MFRQLQLNSPFRDPKWRLNRVLSLVDHQPRPLPCSRRQDDKWIHTYRKFLLEWRVRDGDDERLPLFEENPNLFYAHLLYHHPDKEWRWMIEACLISGATDKEIANELGTVPGMVTMYEKLFFNVRDRLDNEMWVIKTMIGRPEQRQGNREGTLTDNQWAMLLKLFAYYGGMEALKVMFAGFQKGAKPSNNKEIVTWFDETAMLNIRRSAAMIARSYNFDRYSVMHLMELHVRLIELQKTTANEGPATDLDKNIEKMLADLPWGTGKRDSKKLPAPIQPYQSTANELRADDAMKAIRDGDNFEQPLLAPPDVFSQPKPAPIVNAG